VRLPPLCHTGTWRETSTQVLLLCAAIFVVLSFMRSFNHVYLNLSFWRVQCARCACFLDLQVS
jgi:hypothetical protein